VVFFKLKRRENICHECPQEDKVNKRTGVLCTKINVHLLLKSKGRQTINMINNKSFLVWWNRKRMIFFFFSRNSTFSRPFYLDKQFEINLGSKESNFRQNIVLSNTCYTVNTIHAHLVLTVLWSSILFCLLFGFLCVIALFNKTLSIDDSPLNSLFFFWRKLKVLTCWR